MKTRTVSYAVIWKDPETGERGVDCIYAGGDPHKNRKVACLQAEANASAAPDVTWIVECQITEKEISEVTRFEPKEGGRT